MAWDERTETKAVKIILNEFKISWAERMVFFTFGLVEQIGLDEEGDPLVTTLSTQTYSYRFRECWTKGLWTKDWFNNLKATLEAAAENLYGQENIDMLTTR